METNISNEENLALDIIDGGKDTDKENLKAAEGNGKALRMCRDAELLKQMLCEENTSIDIDSRLQVLKNRIKGRRRKVAAAWAAAAMAMAAAVAAFAIITTGKPTPAAELPEGLVYQADGNAPGNVQIIRVTAAGDGQEPAGMAAAHGQAAANGIKAAETIIVSVPKGKSYTLTLPDGTKAYMHADSRITCPERFAGRNRSVKMDGEIYFDVAKDKTHPFVITAHAMSVTVLGTELNVRAMGDSRDNVTLVSGKALVASGNQRTALRPGMQATVDNAGRISLSEVDTAPLTAWRDGFIYFDNAELRDVMTSIGRDYNCNIVFAKKRLMDYKIHFAAERDENVDSVIATLNRMDRIRVWRSGNTITID